MEKLLRSKKIDLISLPQTDGTIEYYAYNQDLLDKNLLIHFYHYQVSDREDDMEVETPVFIKSIINGDPYTFTCFYHNDLIEPAPMVLFRIIVDLVEYIGCCTKETILNDLAHAATNVTKADKEEDIEDYEDDVVEFEEVMRLISEKRATSN